MSDGRVLHGTRREARASPASRSTTPSAGTPTTRRCASSSARTSTSSRADDDIKVVLLRGEGGVFSTGADMGNAYSWYGEAAASTSDGAARPRRPSQRRRLSVDRKTFDFYHELPRLPEGDVAEVRGLRARRRLRAGAHGRHLRRRARHRGRHAGDPLPRPGARLAAHVLLPPRPDAGAPPAAHRRHHPGLDARAPRRSSPRSSTTTTVEARAELVGRKIATHAGRRHRDGEGGVPPRRAAAGRTRARRCASYLFHAFGTNLQFEDGEFNFVKTRAEHGTKQAFELRDEHFDVPEP